MLFPSIFSDNFVDDLFNDVFATPSVSFKNSTVTQMNTDVREFADRYELGIELPGYAKEEIKADLKDGYLTVQAQRIRSNDEKNSDGKYIRRERFSGQCQRSFYVGEEVKDTDIKASFENGILNIIVPKIEPKPEIDERKSIQIM